MQLTLGCVHGGWRCFVTIRFDAAAVPGGAGLFWLLPGAHRAREKPSCPVVVAVGRAVVAGAGGRGRCWSWASLPGNAARRRLVSALIVTRRPTRRLGWWYQIWSWKASNS